MISKEKAMVNVKAFLPDDEEIIDIIRLCDLSPDNDWKRWVDSNGNALTIQNNKKIITQKEKLSKNNNLIKDIHLKASANQISDVSKLALFAQAEATTGNFANICFIWFWGEDDRIRHLCFMRNEWVENQPPLNAGLLSLRALIRNKNISDYKMLASRYIKGSYPSKIKNAWICKWKPSSALKLNMMLANKTLMQRVLRDCGVLSNAI